MRPVATSVKHPVVRVKHVDEPCKMAESIEMTFEETHVWAQGTIYCRWGAYWRYLENTTDRTRRRCGLMANYFDHLFHMIVRNKNDCFSFSFSVLAFILLFTYACMF